MSIYKGSQEIYHIYKGTTRLSALYKGGILIYPKGRWVGWSIPLSRGSLYIDYQSGTMHGSIVPVYFENTSNNPVAPTIMNGVDAAQYEGSATMFYTADPNGAGCFKVYAGTALNSITVHVSCEVMPEKSVNGNVSLWSVYSYESAPRRTIQSVALNASFPVGVWTPIHYSFTIDRSGYTNYDLTIYPLAFERHVTRSDRLSIRQIAMWA